MVDDSTKYSWGDGGYTFEYAAGKEEKEVVLSTILIAALLTVSYFLLLAWGRWITHMEDERQKFKQTIPEHRMVRDLAIGILWRWSLYLTLRLLWWGALIGWVVFIILRIARHA